MSEPARRLGSLYICYLSLDDPLVHSQVVAYLRGLAAAGHRIHLLTFETSRLTRQRRRRWRTQLAELGISWHGLRYHKRPSLPATVYDTLLGAVLAAVLVRRNRLDIIHARSHVPVAMALIAMRLPARRRTGLIFDIRGLWAEEYEDAGRWKRDSLPFRLTKAVERIGIGRADEIVVLTRRIRTQLFGADPPARVHIIPCCADTEGLRRASTERGRLRARFEFGDATVMVYVGKFGGWYMASEMATFFSVARRQRPGLRFLIVTQGDREEIRSELERSGARSEEYTITTAQPEELAAYLAAADFGICFIRPSPSKASTSPTKVGEYLGAGLPVLATSGVGDLDRLLGDDVGVLVSEHSTFAYESAANRILALVRDGATDERCRVLARRELSLAEVGIPRYVAVYERVARRLNDAPAATAEARRS